MKYGESTFDVLYLIFAVTSGCLILWRAVDKTEKRMGIAAIVLGAGDAFHLIPRVLNYFTTWNLDAALGIGKLVTSVTMTVFYLLLYYIWLGHYHEWEESNNQMTVVIWVLAAVRIALCLFPQNGWLENSSSVSWGIYRNIPFVMLGLDICWLYFQKRNEDRIFRFFWILILFSFLFYIPVVVGSSEVPMLGMLMLPKTVCYILMILVFLRAVDR